MRNSQMNLLSLEQVVARRKGRIAFGKALFAGAFAFWNMSWIARWVPNADRFISIASVLVLSWGLAIIASIVASRRSNAKAQGGRRVAVFSNIEALRSEANDLSRRSIAWPLISISLLAPISLHFLVALPFGKNEFEVWMVMSLVLAGFAHFCLALMAWVFAEQKHRMPDKIKGFRFGMLAWLAAIGGAMFPGALAYMIPVILVGVSGVFIPIVFGFVSMRWEQEHQALA